MKNWSLNNVEIWVGVDLIVILADDVLSLLAF
jgi:hypothetical protein